MEMVKNSGTNFADVAGIDQVLHCPVQHEMSGSMK
jgi:hypothetical protein